MNIPNDPFILLSFVNTKLRDFYPTLDEMCAALCVEKTEIVQKLCKIDYRYDSGKNQFV